MCRRVRQVAAPVGRQSTLYDVIFGQVRQMAAPVAKSAVRDCILSLGDLAPIECVRNFLYLYYTRINTSGSKKRTIINKLINQLT